MKLLEILLNRKKYVRPKVLNGSDYDLLQERWKNIEKLIAAGKPSALRQAVVEADKLLEFSLKKLINKDQSLGENLKQAKDLFPDWNTYQQAWEAHKIRNALVHEANFEPTYSVSKEAIAKFKHSLQALGVL
mgnify:CR=1 FL=1